MPKFHSLSIKEIRRESPSAVSLHFNIPQELRAFYAFQAGQYITLETKINGKTVRRAYSLFSTPQSGEIAVVVKEVPGGSFSVYANQKLKINEALDVFHPDGKFLLIPNRDAKNNYAAFAVGSGITPIMSILQTVLKNEPKSTFLLVYGNKTPEETIFLKALTDLQTQFPERFFLEFIFSRTQQENAKFGRISTAISNYFLKNKYKHLVFHSYFLCGPEEMINDLKTVFTANGVAQKDIYFELFTTSEVAPLSETLDGNTTLTVTLDDETTTFVMPQNKSVLESVLGQNLDAPYSCQGGICSTCIARLKEGKVEMRKNQILTDSEIAEGLILTCQSYPTTSVVVVDYDDV
ncbi:MAG: flavodoxin reductase [Bacteroidetes bacterium HGW-Bacteroidetes-2]|jgi:ring-1,2-phenylacetyl-CoA epoxidase subunit PaaE|nr:MAG: flavodoxin reductase [Bacteroidetes bacterium HGW-Bacteroidetes-2]